MNEGSDHRAHAPSSPGRSDTGAEGSAAVPIDVSQHLVEVFGLQVDHLRSERGRLDAVRIAAAVGVTLRQLAAAVEIEYEALRAEPDAAAVQPPLAPIASVLAMLDQTYAGEVERVQVWLSEPRKSLGGQAPREALLKPGSARAVQSWVLGAWLGEPD